MAEAPYGELEGEEVEGQDLGLPPQPRRGDAGFRPHPASEPVQRGRQAANPVGRRSAPELSSRGTAAAVGLSYGGRDAALGRDGGFGAAGAGDEYGEDVSGRDDWAAAAGGSGASGRPGERYRSGSTSGSGTSAVRAAASESQLRSGLRHSSGRVGGSSGPSAAAVWPPGDPDEGLGGLRGDGAGSNAFSFRSSVNAHVDGTDFPDRFPDKVHDGRGRRPSWGVPAGGGGDDAASGGGAHSLSSGRDGRRPAARSDPRYPGRREQEDWEGGAGGEGEEVEYDLGPRMRSGGYGGLQPAPYALGYAGWCSRLESRKGARPVCRAVLVGESAVQHMGCPGPGADGPLG